MIPVFCTDIWCFATDGRKTRRHVNLEEEIWVCPHMSCLDDVENEFLFIFHYTFYAEQFRTAFSKIK